MSRKMMIAGLLAGTAMRMSPAEQRAGRFLRSPDGHEGGAAPAAPTAPEAAASEASAPAAAPAAAPPADAMAALELEMGNVVIPGSPLDEGSNEEPGVSGDDPKDDPAAALEAERHRANAAEEALRVERASKAEPGKEPPKDDAAPSSTQDSDPAPRTEDYEFGAADEKYLADWSRWNARQEFVSLRAKEALTSELNSIEDGWNAATGAEDFKAEFPDFDEVVTKGAAEGKWDCTPLMALAIKTSPVGGQVAYQLAKNPAEATRIANLIPVEQAYEIGRLEGAASASRKAKSAPVPRVASSAPPPPVSRSRGSGGQYTSELSSVQDRMLKEFR